MIGRIMKAEICWAVRGSFTREETATVAAIDSRPSSGVAPTSAISQPGLTIAATTRWDTAKALVPTINITPSNQAITTVGTRAVRHLPTSNSQVLMGVASTGSSVR